MPAPSASAALVDEALREGFAELYVTGGEPFVHPEIVEMIEYAADRMTTVVLTNAMLFTGRRRAELARLAGRPNAHAAVLDRRRPRRDATTAGAAPARGRRRWTGLRYAAGLGLPLRVAMTETPDNRGEVDELRAHAGGARDRRRRLRGAPARAARLRGRRSGAGAIEVSDAVMVPELTITADGAHWHPVGGDLESSPDFLVARGEVSLAEAKRLVVERFLVLRQADGSLPAAFALRGMSACC